MQCKYPAFSKPVPIAEAAQARQHKAQQVTSLETLEETQDKQNLVSSVAVLASRSPQLKKVKQHSCYIFFRKVGAAFVQPTAKLSGY